MYIQVGGTWTHSGRGQNTTSTQRRDRIASLEKALAQALAAAGYEVMNKIYCRVALDPETFAVVRAAFAKHFRKLDGEKSQWRQVNFQESKAATE